MNPPPAILVVDDEAVNRSIASTILASAGWRVEEVKDGRSAVAAVNRGDYALVLMDIQMPGLDGFDTTEAIRSGRGLAAVVPIIAFTALHREDALERAIAVGMDGYIAKPFTAEELIAAVEPWRPADQGNPVRRLAAIFGEAEIASLIDRFRQQLLESLAAEENETERRLRAHKLAGVAGTLGFAEVSRSWLAVSEGDGDSAWGTARIAARKALARLAPKEEPMTRP